MPPELSHSRLARVLLAGLGVFCVGLGAAGAVLPILPTTPFLLLAVACFARSSPRLLERLLASRLLGPYLREWRATRTVPPGAKRRALVLVVLSFALSIALVSDPLARGVLAATGLALGLFLARLPSRPGAPESDRRAARRLLPADVLGSAPGAGGSTTDESETPR